MPLYGSTLSSDLTLNTLKVSSITSPASADLYFATNSGATTFYSPYSHSIKFESAQSGQQVSCTFVTAEGKIAGFSHTDVDNVAGRLFNIHSQPAVPITFSPSNLELLRLNAFGVREVTSIATWLITSPLATSTPLSLKGAASQQNNLLEFKNNSETILSAIQANGRLYFNSTDTPPGNTTTPTAWLDVTVGGSAYKLPLYQ